MSFASYELGFWGTGAAALAITMAALGCEGESKPYPPPPQCTGNCTPGNIGGVGTETMKGSGGTGGVIATGCVSPNTECTTDDGAGGAATTICTNTQTDANNCGACNVVCTAGDICMAGVCTP
jgi:hypothetical protein